MSPTEETSAALFSYNENRARILSQIESKTLDQFTNAPLDLLLSEALYAERMRLRSEHGNVFTRPRLKADAGLLGEIQKGLLKPIAESDRKELLRKFVDHYAEEIGGSFDRGVYEFAVRTVPLGFDWLLNAASFRRFLPWKMTESVRSRLKIDGEVEHLRKLTSKGTILLVPTHQSNMDSLLIGYLIYLMGLPPFSYGAGLNLYSNPVFGFFMRRLGAYTVDREKGNEIYKQTLKNYSTQILREGIHSIFFPGGGRARSGAIESRLKLGLLGTALEAEIANRVEGKPNPKIFVVPMVTSYHFVLEARSLIEDYLAQAGKHRFIITDDESFQPTKVLSFFWKFFSSQSAITVRVGKPMDVFGNFVDENGESYSASGSLIDPKYWFTTRGELTHVPQRDHEYTVELGRRVVDRFHRENHVITSHLVAYSFFESLRAKYQDLDLYRFLRLSLSQRSIPYAEFLAAADKYKAWLLDLERQGRLYVDSEIKTSDTSRWVNDGMTQLGLLHNASVMKLHEGAVMTEDMNLLYYYRNRLSGYGPRGLQSVGKVDAKGFLA